jgi:hypothetical protein
MTTQAPTSRASFDNPATAEERARIIREQRTVNTRSAMTSVLEPSAGGRFAKALGEYTVGALPRSNIPRFPMAVRGGNSNLHRRSRSELT